MSPTPCPTSSGASGRRCPRSRHVRRQRRAPTPRRCGPCDGAARCGRRPGRGRRVHTRARTVLLHNMDHTSDSGRRSGGPARSGYPSDTARHCARHDCPRSAPTADPNGRDPHGRPVPGAHICQCDGRSPGRRRGPAGRRATTVPLEVWLQTEPLGPPGPRTPRPPQPRTPRPERRLLTSGSPPGHEQSKPSPNGSRRTPYTSGRPRASGVWPRRAGPWRQQASQPSRQHGRAMPPRWSVKRASWRGLHANSR